MLLEIAQVKGQKGILLFNNNTALILIQNVFDILTFLCEKQGPQIIRQSVQFRYKCAILMVHVILDYDPTLCIFTFVRLLLES